MELEWSIGFRCVGETGGEGEEGCVVCDCGDVGCEGMVVGIEIDSGIGGLVTGGGMPVGFLYSDSTA